jgi:hypothetical protein
MTIAKFNYVKSTTDSKQRVVYTLSNPSKHMLAFDMTDTPAHIQAQLVRDLNARLDQHKLDMQLIATKYGVSIKMFNPEKMQDKTYETV